MPLRQGRLGFGTRAAGSSQSTSNVVGTTVLTDVRTRADDGRGTLFIPDDDIHVAAKLQLARKPQLKLTGCAFAGPVLPLTDVDPHRRAVAPAD